MARAWKRCTDSTVASFMREFSKCASADLKAQLKQGGTAALLECSLKGVAADAQRDCQAEVRPSVGAYFSVYTAMIKEA